MAGFCHNNLPYSFQHPEMGSVFILKFTWSISPTAGVLGRAMFPGSTPGAPLRGEAKMQLFLSFYHHGRKMC